MLGNGCNRRRLRPGAKSRATSAPDPIIAAILQGKSKELGALGIPVRAETGNSIVVNLGKRTEIWQDGKFHRLEVIDAASYTPRDIDSIVSIVATLARAEGFTGKLYVQQVIEGQKRMVKEIALKEATRHRH